MTSVYTNVLSKEEISYLTNLSEVRIAKATLDARSSGMVYFTAPITESISDALQARFGLHVSMGSSIPMRWIKGDTKPHVDSGRSAFQNTYLLYLNDSAGDFIVDSQTYPIQANTGFIFHEGLSHETQHTEGTPRLLLGPMNELAEPVGAVQATIVYYPTEADALAGTNSIGSSSSYLIGSGNPSGEFTLWKIASNSTGSSPKDAVYSNGTVLNNSDYYNLYAYTVSNSVNCCVPVNSDPRRFSPYVKPTISRSVPLSHEEYLRQKKNLRTTQLSGSPLIVGQAANYPRTVWTQSGSCCSDEPVVPNVLFAGAAQDAGLRTEMLQAVSGRGTLSSHDGFNKNEWNTTLRKKGLAIINDPRFMNPAGDLRIPCTDCVLGGTEREVIPGPTCVVAPPIIYPSHTYFLGLTKQGFGYSYDGINWSLSPSAAFNYCQIAYTAAWNDSFFLLGGGATDRKGVLLVSEDGINWALSSPPMDPLDPTNSVQTITAISASPTSWLLAATLKTSAPLPGGDTTYSFGVFASDNGFNWNTPDVFYTVTSGIGLQATVVRNSTAGNTRLVGFNSAMDYLPPLQADALYFYDGSSWNDTDVFDNTFGIAYDGVIYVAVGVPTQPTKTAIQYSTNEGLIWNNSGSDILNKPFAGPLEPVPNPGGIPPRALYISGIEYGNGIWFAWGKNASNNPIAQWNTTAGITNTPTPVAWTTVTDFGSTDILNSASFVNGQWIATANNGAKLYTSIDGKVWTLSTNPSFTSTFPTSTPPTPVITVPMRLV